MAIRKGIEAAKKAVVKVNITPTSIPHTVLGRFGAGKVLLKPAPEGTGVIAGGTVRAVVEAAGIQNVLTKSLGTTNPHNVVKATMDALLQAAQPGRSCCGARKVGGRNLAAGEMVTGKNSKDDSHQMDSKRHRISAPSEGRWSAAWVCVG